MGSYIVIEGKRQLMSKDLIVAAMSGGVDSTVAACLLASEGHSVIGVTMKLWDYSKVGGDSHQDGRCCSLESMTDARQAAVSFGFPHYILDFQEPFFEAVISDFASEYLAGRTPNPCVQCNRFIKFRALWERARPFGAEKIATGHYARVEFSEERERYVLKKALDLSRDQSYFLWGQTQKELARTLFPLGNMTKAEVRQKARAMGLAVADKPESREICFVPDGNYARFVSEYAGASESGPIIGPDGREVAEHSGIYRFTIGQRHGLGISFGQPVYVKKIDPARRAVYLAYDCELWKRAFVVREANWVSIAPPKKEMRALARIRYLAKEKAATFMPLGGGNAEVIFDAPERAITPGQSAVFYDGEYVLGGGIIEQVIDD